MYEDFDPFAHPQRVEISVGRVESMADDEPDEVVSVVLDGVLKAVLGEDLSEVARPPGAEYRTTFKATRETHVHSWGAFSVVEFIQLHVADVLTDAVILRWLDYLIDKYMDGSVSCLPLTLEAAKDVALQGVVKRDATLGRRDLVVLSEEEEAGGVYHFEIDGGEWLFSLRVEQRKHLALVTRWKRARKER